MSNTAALEAAFDAPAAADREPAPRRRDTRVKDPSGCGQRLGHKIDALLQQVKGDPQPPPPPAATPLAWERSHGEVDPPEPEEHPAVLGDPPSVAAAAAGPGTGEAEPTGASVPIPGPTPLELDGSAWERLVANDHNPADLSELIELLEINATVRSSALMFALRRGQELLEQVACSAPPQTPVMVTAGDLLVLTRAAMARLR